MSKRKRQTQILSGYSRDRYRHVKMPKLELKYWATLEHEDQWLSYVYSKLVDSEHAVYSFDSTRVIVDHQYNDPLAIFPPEILSHIMSFLEAEDLLSSRAVCRNWFMATASLPTVISIRADRQPFDSYLRHLCKCFPSAKNFDIKHGSSFTNDSLEILCTLPALRSISLFGSCQLNESGLDRLSRFENLRLLDLAGANNSAHSTDFLNTHTRLESLDLSWIFLHNSQPEPVQWSALSSLGSLTNLSLAGTQVPVLPALEALSIGNSSNLRTLDLSHCWHANDQCLEFIATTFYELRSLSVASCTQVTDEGLAQLQFLQNLESVDISNCPNITAAGIACLPASVVVTCRY